MTKLWYILHLPTAEPMCGFGNVSAENGFYEQFYTDVALYSTKELAEHALKNHFSSLEHLWKVNTGPKKDFIEHYEVVPYEN